MPEWFDVSYAVGFFLGAVSMRLIDYVVAAIHRRTRPNMGEGCMPPPGYPGGTPR